MIIPGAGDLSKNERHRVFVRNDILTSVIFAKGYSSIQRVFGSNIGLRNTRWSYMGHYWPQYSSVQERRSCKLIKHHSCKSIYIDLYAQAYNTNSIVVMQICLEIHGLYYTIYVLDLLVNLAKFLCLAIGFVDAEIRMSWSVTRSQISASALNLFGGKVLVDLQEDPPTMSRTFMSCWSVSIESR